MIHGVQCIASATFQSLINTVHSGTIFYDYMDDLIVVYIDGILIFQQELRLSLQNFAFSFRNYQNINCKSKNRSVNF